jgi:hypothetical protein
VHGDAAWLRVLRVQTLYWATFVASVVCLILGIVRNTDRHGTEATGIAQAPFEPALALVTWLVAAAYGAVVVVWARVPADARRSPVAVGARRIALEGSFGAVLGAIVTVVLATNDPGDPSGALVVLRWFPVLVLLTLVVVVAAVLGRAVGPAPTAIDRTQDGAA